MLFSPPLLLLSLPFIYGSGVNIRGQCVSGTLNVQIFNRYTDRLGNDQNTNYPVPNTVQVDAKCEDRYLQAKKAKITLKWGQDKLILDFKSEGGSAQPIYLSKLAYEYTKDRPRYPGITQEDTNTVEQEYTENEIPFGTWGKTFKCRNVALNLGGGLKIELKDLQLALFKPDQAVGEATCPAAGLTSPTREVPSGRQTTPRPTRLELTTRGSPTVSVSNTPQHLRFAKENCLKGEADIKLTINYKDDSYHNRSVSYYVPSNADVEIDCESVGSTTKKVLLKFKFGRDVFTLEFSVPSLSGTTVSLRMVEYKYVSDGQRFPGVSRPSETSTTMVSNIYSEGVMTLGEKGIWYHCGNIQLSMGRGAAVAELIGLRLTLFPSSRPSSLSGQFINCGRGSPVGTPTSRPSSPVDRATSRPQSPSERNTIRPQSPGDLVTSRPQSPGDRWTSRPESPTSRPGSPSRTERPGWGPLTTFPSLP